MRRVLSIVAVVLVWACGALASPASGSDMPSVSWNKAIFQTSIDSDACVSVPGKVVSHGVAIGPDQNPVFVADVAGTPATVLLAKYDRETGERLWCTSLPVRAVANKTTFAVPSAQIGGLAIDASGTIFIAGDGGSTPSAAPSSTPGPAAAPANRYFITKCSPAGVCAQTVTFVSPAISTAHADKLADIAVGSDGNPVLTGVATVSSANGKQTSFSLLTVKLSGATLGLLGQAQADVTAPGAGSRQSVAVDASNNVIVTATDAATWKYDPLLRLLWSSRAAGSRIAVGGTYNAAIAIVATGTNRGTGGPVFTVTNLDGATGQTLWNRSYESVLGDTAHDIAVDGQGNILISFVRGELVGLNRSGGPAWVLPGYARDDRWQYSAAGLAAGPDGAPVVAVTASDARDSRRGWVHVINYIFRRDSAGYGDAWYDDGHDGDDDGDHGALRWDEAEKDVVTGFVVCVDLQPRSTCQDVGKPAGRRIPSTTDGSITYQIALARLRWLTSGRHQLTVIAYNTYGDSPRSRGLIVDNERGGDEHGRWDDGDRDDHRAGDRDGDHASGRDLAGVTDAYRGGDGDRGHDGDHGKDGDHGRDGDQGKGGRSGPASATPTLIQHVSTASNDDTSEPGNPYFLSLPNLTGAGNALILGMSYEFAPGNTPTVTDDKGNVWVAGATTPSNPTSGQLVSAIFYSLGIAAGTQKITVTFTLPVTSFQAVFSEFYNVATVAALDGSSSSATSIAPSITAGSLTTATNGDLIYSYGYDTNPTDTVTQITAGSGFTLLSADTALGTFAEYAVQGSAGAVVPGATVTGTTDPFNSVAIALKAQAAGTAPAPGIHIVHVYHVLYKRLGSALQFPSTGNLLVVTTSFSPNQSNLSVASSLANTWVKPAPASNGADLPQFLYAANAATSPSLQITPTVTFPVTSIVMYDVAGAAAAPYDSAAGMPYAWQSNVDNSDLIGIPVFTPSTANELVFGTMADGIGPTTGLIGTGFFFDTVTYGGEIDRDSMDNADGYAHYFSSSTAPVSFSWKMNSNDLPETSLGVAIGFISAP